jgi:glucose dehydrogenase
MSFASPVRAGVIAALIGCSLVAVRFEPAAGSSTLTAAGAQSAASDRFDWPQHNLDLRGSRYAAVADIDRSNVGRLAVKWSLPLEASDIVTQVTPLVIDGVMYLNAGSKLIAVDGATGKVRWTRTVEPAFPGSTLGRRGAASDDGRVIYAYGGSGGSAVLFAVDARTGQIVESFGNKGRLQIADAAVHFKYPEKDPTGYEMAAPPTFHNGVIYAGLAQSEKRIAGGLMVALDAKSGAIKWVFNTVPQGPTDDGWDVAKDSWSGGGGRIGGGIWTTPTIDADLGLVYFNAGNPWPDWLGTGRKGTNLFTNSIIALRLQTGKLAWHLQTIHHDLWDWDLVTGPLLFDATDGTRTVRGIASAGKNCFLYLLNRATGQPINPIVETPVSTATDIPGEQPWPTQPFPYTAKGVPMQPFCSTFPVITDPQLAKLGRPAFTPYSTKEPYIVSHGGSSFGSPSFSPRTGFVYVTGKNAAVSYRIRPVDEATFRASTDMSPEVAKRDNPTGVALSETVSAYNPITGELVWQEEHSTKRYIGSAGNLVTAGDLVFQGADTGEFYALDARTGARLFTYKGALAQAIKASPITYRTGGRQYVSVVGTDTILTFGLP